MRALLILLFGLLSMACIAHEGSSKFYGEREGLDISATLEMNGLEVGDLDYLLVSSREDQRLISILLGVALGPFGGHRLYLGTKPHVPVVYTLTLGGGFGILPLIDIFHLIFTKDLDRFRNNGNVFMWRPDPTPP